MTKNISSICVAIEPTRMQAFKTIIQLQTVYTLFKKLPMLPIPILRSVIFVRTCHFVINYLLIHYSTPVFSGYSHRGWKLSGVKFSLLHSTIYIMKKYTFHTLGWKGCVRTFLFSTWIINSTIPRVFKL